MILDKWHLFCYNISYVPGKVKPTARGLKVDTLKEFYSLGKEIPCQKCINTCQDFKTLFFYKLTYKNMQSLHSNEKYHIRYLIVPDFVFDNEKLSLLSIKIYSFIHSYRAEQFFFSNEKLAEIFNCEERSVSRAISQLKEEKYIECEQPQGRKRYITDLRDDLSVYPGLTQVSTHIELDGSTRMSTHNLLNDDDLSTKSEDFGVPNKNNINKNILANFENDPIDVKEVRNNLTPEQKRRLRESRRSVFPSNKNRSYKFSDSKDSSDFVKKTRGLVKAPNIL